MSEAAFQIHRKVAYLAKIRYLCLKLLTRLKGISGNRILMVLLATQ